MQTYELTYIIADGATDDDATRVMSEVAKNLESLGAVIIKEEPWGKRKLAYLIGKNAYGTYVTLQMHIEGGKVTEIERFLRLHPEIIRSLVLKAPPQVSKPTDEAELVEALDKRVEEKKSKKSVDEPKPAESAVAIAESTVGENQKKPKRKSKASSNEAEKKQESEEERKKLVDEKLNEILGE